MVLKVFTPDEITAHNNADEPWIVIHDRVYSVKHLLAEVSNIMFSNSQLLISKNFTNISRI